MLAELARHVRTYPGGMPPRGPVLAGDADLAAGQGREQKEGQSNAPIFSWICSAVKGFRM